MTVIGIDLGTTKSCVGVFRNGEVEIIQNDHGNRVTASYVAFTKTEILIGDSAKNQAGLNPENTVYNVKRFMGRKLSDSKIENELNRLPFKVLNKNGNSEFEVTYKDRKEIFVPEEISALIIRKMKDLAETYLGIEVTDAVISVPACFTDSQRRATLNAAKIAGLNILRILNAPTAVALANVYQKSLNKEKTILVYDLGGGHSDASIISITEGPKFKVIATSGDYIGGEDFDNSLVDHFLQQIIKTSGKDVRSNKRAIMRLKKEVERVKRALSSGPTSIIEIDSLYDGNDFESKISRDEFEELCLNLFKRSVHPIEKVLCDAKINKSDIDDVILVGGASRMPKIQALIQEFFNGKMLTLNMNAEEATTCGTAILSNYVKEITIEDITSFALEINHQIYQPLRIVERFTSLPFLTKLNFQPNEAFWVSEQGSTNMKQFLGKFQVAYSTYPISVIFLIDSNGILRVTVENKDSHPKNEMIKCWYHCLSNKQLEEMIAKAKCFQEEERYNKKCVTARSELEKCVFCIKKDVLGFNLDESEKSLVGSRCNDTISWMDSNHLLNFKEYESALENLQNFVTSLLEKKTATTSDENRKKSTEENNQKNGSSSHKEDILEKPIEEDLEQTRKIKDLQSELLNYATKIWNDIKNSGPILSIAAYDESRYCHEVIIWFSNERLRNQVEYENINRVLLDVERSVFEKKKEVDKNIKGQEVLMNFALDVMEVAKKAEVTKCEKELIIFKCENVVKWIQSIGYKKIEEVEENKREMELLLQSLATKKRKPLLQRSLDWLLR